MSLRAVGAGKKQGKWSIINRLQWVHVDMSLNIYSGMISTQYGPDPHKTQVRGFSLKKRKECDLNLSHFLPTLHTYLKN